MRRTTGSKRRGRRGAFRSFSSSCPTAVGMLDAGMTLREMQPAHRANEVKPLAPERFKIQFTVGRETYEKFRQAQNLLRHSIPDGDPALIFERALNVLVTSLERRMT